MLMESVEIMSGLLSGSGEMFRTSVEFWSTWLSGKMIPLDRARQLNVLSGIFGLVYKGSALVERLAEELANNPEIVPGYVELPPNNVSMSRFTAFVLKVIVERNLTVRDDTVKQFRVMAGADKVLSYTEFKKACIGNRPISEPPEGSYAFMYWRAVMMNEKCNSKDVIFAVSKWEVSLVKIGGDSCTVSVDDAVESFMWHCGKFNQCGKQQDGSSILEKTRESKHLAAKTKAPRIG
mmetsp:Transcript_37255/g.92119  ORF Transcript_37255/g.92119 Transcript_37255/m.92119 type:complete len:236 (+) Transcript_37255:1-708(+)